ncbi:MAG: oxidoreductase, partial [Rhodospirillaceae bacterium]|nr:oxidoreductase [Rhodospirillaceae bacterium]
VCATEAIAAKKLDDGEMAKLVDAEGLEVLNPEFGTRPRVYYKNLYRYNKCFIGGSVATTKDGTSDCVEGASVKLSQGSDVIAEATTDVFGDFKFDRLDENSGTYKVEISADGHGSKSLDVELSESVTLGNIFFDQTLPVINRR